MSSLLVKLRFIDDLTVIDHTSYLMFHTKVLMNRSSCLCGASFPGVCVDVCGSTPSAFLPLCAELQKDGWA